MTIHEDAALSLEAERHFEQGREGLANRVLAFGRNVEHDEARGPSP